MRRLKIVYSSVIPVHLVRLASLAETIGVTPEYVPLAASGSLARALEDVSADTDLILDVASLSSMSKEDDLCSSASIVRNRSLSILLLTTTPDKASSHFVDIITAGKVRGVELVSASTTISFQDAASKSAGELASYSYVRKQGKALVSNVSDGTGIEILMKLDNAPAFVRLSVGSATMFVWSTPKVFDIIRPLAAELEFEQAVDEYIPAIIFLRSAFGKRCWHNPKPAAGIVIDDPLLKKNYGFIKFPQLLESARTHQYRITLAFIPWNYWRSRTRDARVFLNYADCFNLCAHGCDHTDNEFRSSDYEALLCKNFVARKRMERHRQRTGLASDPLMVCPQEQYSLAAMRAFADSRQFAGVICTACMPRDLTSPRITGADLLLPAQDSFYGVPVFKRHYWSDIAVFAMAFFLGKPAILVEHHEFFRNGPVAAEKFVDSLAELRPDLKWKSLVETVTRTHARRRVSQGRWEVRFFTDTFQLEHEVEDPADYRLLRRISKTTAIERVLVGGKEVPFGRENGFLTFEIHVHRPQTLLIKVVAPSVKPTRDYSFGLKYQASVVLRRGLSELRDNIIVRNRFALKASSRLMTFLKHRRSQGVA